jgi:protein-L-isoaspartate(D-aspartate) O-methyltransferase
VTSADLHAAESNRATGQRTPPDVAAAERRTPLDGAAAERRTMVDSQLRTVGVLDEAVLGAMYTLPREDFMPAALRGLAYADATIEVAAGRWLLEPMTLALLIQHAQVKRGERALVVGSATGYSAAVLAHIGLHVTALESDPALVAMATNAGVTSVSGSLEQGWPAAAPYDVILFEGAIETIPAGIAAPGRSSGAQRWRRPRFGRAVDQWRPNRRRAIPGSRCQAVAGLCRAAPVRLLISGRPA